MAWNKRELECEPSSHHRESDYCQRIERANLGNLAADIHQIRARRRTVKQSHAVGDKARGEGAYHEVLQPSLDTDLVALQESVEYVERDR